MDYSLLNKIGFCESVDNVNSLKQINKWMKKKAVVPCSRMLINKKKKRQGQQSWETKYF